MAEVSPILESSIPPLKWPKNVVPVSSPETSSPPLPRTLERLLDVYGAAGQAAPLAVVVSIFDDLLSVTAAHDRPHKLRTADVFVDSTGRAHFAGPQAARASLSSVITLLLKSLGREEDVPPSSRGLITRLRSEAALDRPQDADQLREWLRVELAVAALHDEVSRVFAKINGEKLEIPPLEDEYSYDLEPQEAALGSSSDSLDFVVPMLPPVQVDTQRQTVKALNPVNPIISDVPVSDIPVSDVPSVPSAISEVSTPSTPAFDPETSPTKIDTRPVIRHQMPKPTIRLDSAPAARRSAKASPSPRDRLNVPGVTKPHWGAWLFVIALLVIGALFWMRFI